MPPRRSRRQLTTLRLDHVVRTCIVCGCTDLEACEMGCGWTRLEPPVCSTHFEHGEAGGRLLLDTDLAKDLDDGAVAALAAAGLLSGAVLELFKGRWPP